MYLIISMNQLRTICIFGLLLLSSNMCSSKQNMDQQTIPLKDDASLDKLIAEASNKELVLLGEASHGTHEYYLWRDKISRRLIEEENFNFIAVEGDFASLYHLNLYVKNLDGAQESAKDVLSKLDRWPTWMWANEEVVALRSEEHTSELQSRPHLVCRLLLEKKNKSD